MSGIPPPQKKSFNLSCGRREKGGVQEGGEVEEEEEEEEGKSPAPARVFHVYKLTPPLSGPALPTAAANPLLSLCPCGHPFLPL